MVRLVDEYDEAVLKVLGSWSGVGEGDGRRVSQRLLWFPPPSLAAQQGVCSHHAVLSLVAGRHGCDISPFLRYEEQKKKKKC